MFKRKRQFTLVELLLVIMLIAALSGIAFSVTSFAHRKTDETEMTALIEQIKLLNEQYKQKYGFYLPGIQPEQDKSGSVSYLAIPFNANFLKDSYDHIKNIHRDQESKAYVLDIWGNPLRYRAPGKFNTGSFDIYSCGPDGQPGLHSSNHGWIEAGKGDDIATFKNNRKD